MRHAVEQFCFRPLGLRLGLKERERPRPRDNPVLERAHRAGAWHMPALAREAGVTNIQAERWLRQKRRQQLPSTLQKFQETGWRWLFYTLILIYGFTCLWTKPWFWNIRHCWYDYPYHQIDVSCQHVMMGTLTRLPTQVERKVGMTSNHHGPYVLGHTRNTMAGTEGSYTAM